MSEQALVECYRARQQQEREHDFTLQAGELPTRIHLEQSMLGAVCGKASGPDQLPPEVLKFGGGALSQTLYALFLKMSIRMDEALQWKGGVIHHAWKGKQAPDECASHRALLISSVIGKALHSTIRRCCIAPMRSIATPFQVGGLPYPVTFASHCVRLFQSLCAGATHFLLFLDLREAFYRVYRALLGAETPSDEAVAGIFRRLELPPSAFEQFRQQAASDNALLAAGSSSWLRAVLKELMSNTWFKLPGQVDAVQTSLGVRPRNALADSWFFAQVLRETRQVLATDGLLHEIPWQSQMHGALVAWQGRPERMVALCDGLDGRCMFDGKASQCGWGGGGVVQDGRCADRQN